jgi:hypothetical protein
MTQSTSAKTRPELVLLIVFGLACLAFSYAVYRPLNRSYNRAQKILRRILSGELQQEEDIRKEWERGEPKKVHVGGHGMVNEDYDRRKLAYEKALEIRYHQVHLLYQMLTFFLAGMSFIVVAFATVVASASASELHAASRAIMVLGIALSALFTMTALFQAHTIRKFDDYLLSTESKLGLADTPFETIMGSATDYPSGLGRVVKWIAEHFRPAMAWVIPILFIAFWVFMCVMFWGG